MNDQYEVRMRVFGGLMNSTGLQDLINQQQAFNQQMGVQQMGAQPDYGQLQQQQLSQYNFIPRLETVKKRGIMKAFKDYLTEHKDVIFTLMILLLVDHFVFGDAFKEKIKGSLDKLLDRAHEKIG